VAEEEEEEEKEEEEQEQEQEKEEEQEEEELLLQLREELYWGRTHLNLKGLRLLGMMMAMRKWGGG